MKICENAWEDAEMEVDDTPNNLYVELEMILWMLSRA